MRICLVALVLLCNVVLASAESRWTDRGNYSITWYNSTKSEFKISTADEFAGIAVLVNGGYTDFAGKTIILESDIDLQGNTWIPIGNLYNKFKGKVNGNGHLISGIHIVTQTDNELNECYGLFGSVEYSEISGIEISGSISIAIDNYYVKQYVGSLCAYAYNSKFEQIKSTVDISYIRNKMSSTKYEILIGGVFGKLVSSDLVFVSYEGNPVVNYGYSNYTDDSVFRFGGIVGTSEYGRIKYCATKANFHIELGSSSTLEINRALYVGGISGYTYGTEFLCCKAIINKANLKPAYNTKPGYIYFGGISAPAPANYPMDKGYIHNCFSVIHSLEVTLSHGKFYYGGIFGDNHRTTTNCPQKYTFNYSNTDYNIIHVYGFPFTEEDGFSGGNFFSSSEMMGRDFVDELNLYFTLNNQKGMWCYVDGDYPSIEGDEFGSVINMISVQQNPTIRVIDGVIIIDDLLDEPVFLYKMDGSLIYSGYEHHIKGLSRGIYVLKYGIHTQKIKI